MLAEFLKVRQKVDSDELLDGYDFTLGFLLGKGVSHARACDWIDAWAEAGHLTWPAREDMKARRREAAARQNWVDQIVKNVSE